MRRKEKQMISRQVVWRKRKYFKKKLVNMKCFIPKTNSTYLADTLKEGWEEAMCGWGGGDAY